MFWRVPSQSWLKVNTDTATHGCLGLMGFGGVFRTFRGFFRGGFAIFISKAYAFDVELAAAIHATISYV